MSSAVGSWIVAVTIIGQSFGIATVLVYTGSYRTPLIRAFFVVPLATLATFALGRYRQFSSA